MALAAVSLYLLALAWTNLRPVHGNNRHAVYWNSSNIHHTNPHHHGHSCLRLRVFVCCSTASNADDDSNQSPPDYTVTPKLHDIDEFNPEIPKLEKSVSGSSPSGDRLLITVATLLLAALLVS
ncbi:ephrin-A3-like [Cyprinus carpio]|uniref:Ephrin-A3-like n=1 Tax=Cyprinus carpio TaxID=7962 RepID=A0A9Q9XHI1_CYPCA|nr:ephrin-A3-like [Cyprinus carpio]